MCGQRPRSHLADDPDQRVVDISGHVLGITKNPKQQQVEMSGNVATNNRQ
jgi:hypothetical protein